MSHDMGFEIRELTTRTYFDGLIVRLENLIYELSMSATPGTLVSWKVVHS